MRLIHRWLFPLLTLPLYLTCETASAQIYAGGGGPIPDNGNSVDFTINVTGLTNNIDTTGFGLESVCINILHTWDSDLDIFLIAPDSTVVTLVSGAGGGGDNFIGTCFRNDVPNSIYQGSAPFTATYRPQGQLGTVNNGQDPNGTWTLHILDTYPFADAGVLLSWTIQFGNNPATVFALESSDIPVVLINTNGQSIPDDPKITGWMGIIDNGPGIRNYVTDPPNDYDGYIGIELRGTSSLSFPQKQYGIETRDSSGVDTSVAILGMPPESDWVLYAPYNDKTLMRNALTYSLARDMGRYASRSRFCELVLNGEYKGVYTFFEKIKRDSARVSISKLTPTDTAGADVTGGYICSLDWVDNDGWYSNYPPDPTNPTNNDIFYQYIYPKDDVIHSLQEDYIQQYVDSFETALSGSGFGDPLTGWRKYAHEGSFIDYYIMNELSKNVDGYRLSAFFYKEKITDGNMIKMGPLWDFNLAWHNADYCNNQFYGGWAYEFTDFCAWDFPFWWRRLNQDTLFQNNVRCRWEELRTGVLDTAYMFNYIDSIATLLDESRQRHFYTYPILGIYVWPNPSPIPTTYAGEINSLKTWIRNRVIFMDNNLPGNCIISGTANGSASSGPLLNVYPNPARDEVTIAHPDAQAAIIRLLDVTGRTVRGVPSNRSGQTVIEVADLPDGMYLVTLEAPGMTTTHCRFVKKGE
jgi:subtilisin-like proprotein convertase family protein